MGLGNILLRDEGVGVHIIKTLKESYDVPENVRLIDGGTMGLDLLPFIEGMDKVIIIDAVNLDKEPGTIEIIENDDIPSFISTKISIHQIGLPDVLAASRLLEITPAWTTLVGIQPESIETGLEMTGALKNNFERLLDTVIKILFGWGFEIKEKIPSIAGS